jgi:hypothetical protein
LVSERVEEARYALCVPVVSRLMEEHKISAELRNEFALGVLQAKAAARDRSPSTNLLLLLHRGMADLNPSPSRPA